MKKKERIRELNDGYGNDFIKALINFSEISNDDVFALYALRCSFVHDFFLLNSSSKKEKFNHHFSVTASNEGRVVELPHERWNGNLESRKEENKTIINLELLGDLVEEMHKSVFSGIESGKAKVKDGALLEYLEYRE